MIIDGRPSAITDANLRGYAAIEGDATRRDILRRAEIIKAREVIITLDRDDSAILVMLTVRQLNPSAHVVVAVREDDNASLLRQSGANAVVTSSEAVGRLLGLSAVSPNLGIVIEDLLSSREGLEVGERQVTKDEIGKSPDDVTGDRVIAVVRNKTLRRFYDPTVAHLEAATRSSSSARRSKSLSRAAVDAVPARNGGASPEYVQRGQGGGILEWATCRGEEFKRWLIRPGRGRTAGGAGRDVRRARTGCAIAAPRRSADRAAEVADRRTTPAG